MIRAPKLADRLVERASGVLDRRVSRRGFIAKTTIAGSAVAVAGCIPVTRPGSPYTFITDCPPGSLCHDGNSDFCCTINRGQNACPPNSFPSGWWRADYSVYCNGTRYYIDCNDWAGGGPCRCGDGCGHRKVYCNSFRYGQCNQHIPGSGVIACRIVTCVPPYVLPGLNCSPSGAVNNSTAGHNVDCTPYVPAAPAPAPPPPPKPTSPPAAALPLGGAASPGPGEVVVLTRTSDGAVGAQHYSGGAWQGWQTLPLPGVTAASRVVAISPTPGIVEALVVGSDRQLWWQHWEAGAWGAGWQPLGGNLRSDPAVAIIGGVVHVAVRTSSKAISHRRLSGGVWGSFVSLGGTSTSDPSLAGRSTRAMLLIRGADAAMYAKERVPGGWRSKWTDLSGIITSDPAVLADPSGYWAFGRSTDNAVYVKRWSSSWQGDWQRLKGKGARSDPAPVLDGSTVRVFIRGSDHRLYGNRRSGSGWAGWQSLGNPDAGTLGGTPLAVFDGTHVLVFASASDQMHVRRLSGGGPITGWETLPGITVAPVRGASQA